MAVDVGFEPTELLHPTVFKTVKNQPLCQSTIIVWGDMGLEPMTS